jgi:hypothetical protein
MATQKKLIKGYSAKSIGKNIGYEMKKHPGQSQKQNIAIALSTARAAAPKAMKSKFNPPKK